MRTPSSLKAVLIVVTLATFAVPAFAFWGDGGGRNTTVIEGPGFKTESHKGWFGSGSQSYQDALGNRISNEKNWFGRKRTDTSIFGATVKQSRNNTQITAPNGTPILERKRGWFGGQQTRINANSLSPLFNSTTAAPYNNLSVPQSSAPQPF